MRPIFKDAILDEMEWYAWFGLNKKMQIKAFRASAGVGLFVL